MYTSIYRHINLEFCWNCFGSKMVDFASLWWQFIQSRDHYWLQKLVQFAPHTTTHNPQFLLKNVFIVPFSTSLWTYNILWLGYWPWQIRSDQTEQCIYSSFLFIYLFICLQASETQWKADSTQERDQLPDEGACTLLLINRRQGIP